MKLLLSLCAIICAISFCNAAGPDDIAACSRQTKIDSKIMQGVKVTDDYTPTEDVKNIAACLYKRDGVMNQDGTINLNFGQAEVKLGSLCKITKAGADLTENVATLMKCFTKLDEEEKKSMKQG